MRVVFFGTPDVAATSLRALLASRHDVVAVVTQPDKPRGRGRTVRSSPVKDLATEAGVALLQPPTPKREDFADEVRALEPDALAIVAYGHILPPPVLAIAPAVNVHFSSLPRYRGAAPVQRAIMAGETETGVSVFLLEATVDTGPVLTARTVPIGPHQTAGEVLDTLAPIGASLLVETLDALEGGTVEPLAQDARLASPAPKIGPHESLIDWSAPAPRIEALVRALNPAPGARARFGDGTLLIWRSRALADDGPAGVVLAVEPRLVVGAGAGALELQEVQPEGKRRMDGTSFARGYRPRLGESLSRGRG